MSEEEISETLNRVVPSRDVPEGMLAGARRRRRRTRVAAGSGAVALVTALIVSLGLTMGSSNEQVVATPAPTPSTTATAGPTSLEPDACRDAEADHEGASSLPDYRLPDGATRVWLCGGPSESIEGSTYVGAPEPLTLNVADAVAAFNAVPSTVGVMSCGVPNSFGFTVIYEYPDGEMRRVQGGIGGCEVVMSDSAQREDARGYLEALRALWTEQRSAMGTVFDADVEVCSARISVMGVGIADMTRAYACGPVGQESPATDSVQIALSDELVADIVAEITAQDVSVGTQPGMSVAAPSMVFLSPTGDPFTIHGTPEGYSWYDPEPAGMNHWVPSAELAARIYDEMTRDGICTLQDAANGLLTCQAVTETPSPSDPSTANPDGLPGWMNSGDDECDLDADGRMATTDLPKDTLPDGPNAVWLCSTMRAPFEPLVGSKATQELVDSFKKLSTTPPTDQRSATVPSYLVVLYPDGQRYVVHVDRESSFEVTWGSAGQHVRYGGRDWVLGLEELWVNQRNDNPLEPPAAPKVGICDNLYRSLGRTIGRYDVDGALCTVVETSSGDPLGVELPTPPQLLADVIAGVRNDGFSWPTSNENPLNGWRGDSILLVDDYGDRQPLMRRADETYFWVEGSKIMAWKPSPDLTARLAQAFDDGRPSPHPTHS